MRCICLQVKKCADAGADIVRITVQGKKEAEACYKIREQLFKDKYVQLQGCTQALFQESVNFERA